MKRLLAVLLLVSVPAFAQQQPVPKTYTFTMKDLTLDQANMVLNKLGELPWKDANGILPNLIAQANEQSRLPSPGTASLPKE